MKPDRPLSHRNPPNQNVVGRPSGRRFWQEPNRQPNGRSGPKVGPAIHEAPQPRCRGSNRERRADQGQTLHFVWAGSAIRPRTVTVKIAARLTTLRSPVSGGAAGREGPFMAAHGSLHRRGRPCGHGRSGIPHPWRLRWNDQPSRCPTRKPLCCVRNARQRKPDLPPACRRAPDPGGPAPLTTHIMSLPPAHTQPSMDLPDLATTAGPSHQRQPHPIHRTTGAHP